MAVTGKTICRSTTGMYPMGVAGGTLSYMPLMGNHRNSTANTATSKMPITQLGTDERGERKETRRSANVP